MLHFSDKCVRAYLLEQHVSDKSIYVGITCVNVAYSIKKWQKIDQKMDNWSPKKLMKCSNVNGDMSTKVVNESTMSTEIQ